MGLTVAEMGALGCAIAGIAGYAGYILSTKKENEQEGQNRGTLLTEIGYIKAGIDDIKKEQKDQAGRHNELAERVTRVEESSKQAHLRINRLEQKEGDH